jgi:hypothetical protein
MDKHTILEALASRKEVPFGWLVTFLAGGLANFAMLVWMASAVVHDVADLKINTAANAAEMQRAAVTDADQNARINVLEKKK